MLVDRKILFLALLLHSISSATKKPTKPADEITKAFRWIENSRSCKVVTDSVNRFLLDRNTLENQIVCFTIRVKQEEQNFAKVTPFNAVFSYYLLQAMNFLSHLFQNTGFVSHRKVFQFVWRIEDVSDINPKLVESLTGLGIHVVGHSFSEMQLTRNITLVPNFHFIESGYAELVSSMHGKKTLLVQRKPKVFWTGSTTGLSHDGLCQNLPRVRMVQISKNISWLNMSLSKVVQSCSAEDEKWMREQRLFSERVTENEWTNYRGIMDIDGNVDAWGNRWRLSSGSVVFMVKSQFISFYSEHLQDGVHYIGVASDLSDLSQKTEVVRSQNLTKIAYLQEIADNARNLMTKFTSTAVLQNVRIALKMEALQNKMSISNLKLNF